MVSGAHSGGVRREVAPNDLGDLSGRELTGASVFFMCEAGLYLLEPMRSSIPVLLLLSQASTAFFVSNVPSTVPARACRDRLSISRRAATLEDQSEFARAELARKQREYDAQLKQRMKDEARSSASNEAVPILAELPVLPYLTPDGLVNDPGVSSKVKASVYAVLNEERKVVYIGVSRSVAQSLRLHLARVPDQTYWFQVFHITKPSRVLLELTREAWMEQLGYIPSGNDEGALQAMWEAPMDVKPLMTPADHAAIETAREKQRPEEMAIKKIARRFEDAKVQVLESRGVKESLRFDPKLKGQGLLDLYMEKPKDEVPKEKPK